jgi:hypothetical protein
VALTALLVAALSMGVGRGASEQELRQVIRQNSKLTRESGIELHHIRGLGEDDIVAIRYGGGKVAYARADGSLWSAPFDESNRRITGKPAQIGSNVALGAPGEAQFSISRKGTVSFIEEGPRMLGIVTKRGMLHP